MRIHGEKDGSSERVTNRTFALQSYELYLLGEAPLVYLVVENFETSTAQEKTDTLYSKYISCLSMHFVLWNVRLQHSMSRHEEGRRAMRESRSCRAVDKRWVSLEDGVFDDGQELGKYGFWADGCCI